MQKSLIPLAFLLLFLLSACSDALIVDVRITAPGIVTANSRTSITGYANPEPGLSKQNTALTWSIQSGPGLLLDVTSQSVVYGAPNVSKSTVVVIRATSVSNTNKFLDVTITITP
jgi:hypothetical protein